MAKKAKKRQAAKKSAAPKTRVKKAAKAAAGTPRAKLPSAVSRVAQAVGIGVSTSAISAKGGYGFRKRKSAKQALKKAYEKRAFYLIRTNQLGQARKALRKKATVV